MEAQQTNEESRGQRPLEGNTGREQNKKADNRFLGPVKSEEDENLSGEISGDTTMNMDSALSTGGDLHQAADSKRSEIKDSKARQYKQKSHAENVGGTSEEDIRMGRD